MGGSALVFTATLTNSSASVSWALSGLGALSGSFGTTITYYPPVSGPGGAATLTATAGALTAVATISVNFPPTPVAVVAAYAWADNKTSASYAANPTYSYNAIGGTISGTITATRSAVGAYGMNFAGLTIDSGDVQVTAYNSAAECTVTHWGGNLVNVNCFDATGSPVDSEYTVSVILNNLVSTAGSAAYAWADDSSSASYTPSGGYSYNAGGGAITATRSAVGVYSMQFAGLPLSGGNVQVSAYNSAAKCNVAGWGLGQVAVHCFDATGSPVDSQYTVSVILNHPVGAASMEAYAYANISDIPSYTPNVRYSYDSYNSSGQAITASTSGVGLYTMAFSGIGLNGGNVKVSAYQSNALCNVASWGTGSIQIACYDSTGAPVNSQYTVVYMQ